MDFILNGISSVLNKMSAVLRGFEWTHDLGNDIAALTPYLRKANAFVPVSTALTVLAIFVSLQLILIAYYWITRTINLLRGAG